VQSTPKWFDGDGLPAPFVDFALDGKPVARGEPTRMQVVERSAPRSDEGM
jgi:hypothetical protein